MGRDLTAGVATAVAAQLVRPVLFYEGEYASGTLRLWTGFGDFTWNAQTWNGAGNMLGIGPVEEVSEIRATSFYVSLSGDAAALLSANLGQARTGLPGKVWIGFFDAAGALIADPFLAFHGRFDVPDIVDEGARATIQARYESRLIDLDRPRLRRYTDEDHRLDFPSDQGFGYVVSLQDKEIFWGRDSVEQKAARAARFDAMIAARVAAGYYDGPNAGD